MEVKDTDIEEDGVILKTDEGNLKLQVIDPSIIRIIYSNKNSFSDPESLMVKPQKTETKDWSVEETDSYYKLKTEEIELEADRSTCAFTWRDKNGKLLVKEPSDGGKKLEEVTEDLEEIEEDRELYSTLLQLDFSDDEAIYGLGQHEEGKLNYRGDMQYLYQHNMKAAMPAIVSTRGYGILWDTYSFGIFRDHGQGSHFWTECDDEMVFYFIHGPEFDDIVSGFRELTGKATMFPKWAYGYVQSKERYESQEELVSVVQEYRDRDIPIDVIIQDWQYWPEGTWGEKYFDDERFPDPDALTNELHSMNTRLVISVWPNMIGGKNEKEMKELDVFYEDEELRAPFDKNTYNPFDEEAREMYWKHANDGIFSHGIDGWWCDSTEPFNADWDRDIKPEPHQRAEVNTNLLKRTIGPEFINAFSLMHSKGIYEGQRSVTDEKRVINLTRSGYPGQQRYGAITWSGDIEASWERLESQIAEGLNFTITGNPKWTLDIGGFFVTSGEEGNLEIAGFPVDDGDKWARASDYSGGHENEGYRELFVRWFQLGAFLPMFRSHGTDTPREVWRFGEPGDVTYDTLVKFDYLRYRLLPYIYSLAGWETQKDYTMYRNLAFDFREDEKVYDVADQFMFGPSLMVCPVTEPMYYDSDGDPIEGKAKAREVYLPKQVNWYDFWTGDCYEGGQRILTDAPLEKIPLFVPSGSLIPMGQKVQHAEKAWEGSWELRVYDGKDAEFEIYNDAGDGYDYEDGEFAYIPLVWNDMTGKLTIGERQGSFSGMKEEREFNVVKVDEGVGVGLEESEGRRIDYSGQETSVEGL